MTSTTGTPVSPPAATAASSRRHGPPKPLIALVLLALLAISGYWWWSHRSASDTSDQVASGSVEAKQYQVASAMAGTVTSVAVTEGQRVAKGQVLLTLDGRALKLQVDQANQGVNAAKAALRKARDDGTSADVAAAQARLLQAEAAVSLAKVQQGYARVVAPHAGVVAALTTNVGQVASPGRTVVTITDPADIYARVFVAESQIGSVKIGHKATATSDVTSTTFPGTVTFVSTQSEFTPNNVQTKDQRTKLVYEVRVALTDSTGTLKPGLPVDVNFR